MSDADCIHGNIWWECNECPPWHFDRRADVEDFDRRYGNEAQWIEDDQADSFEGAAMISGTDTEGVIDFVFDKPSFSIHARQAGPEMVGYVYFQSEVVFVWHGQAGNYPAGLEDFANIALRQFAKRLRTVLAL